MARPKKLTVAELNRLYGDRLASATVQNGFITGFALFPVQSSAPPQTVPTAPTQATEPRLNDADLALDPPAGMAYPPADYGLEQN